MKNLLLYVSMLLFTSIGTLFAQTYSGGAGTAENPYQISTLEDLRYLSENGEADWDKHFIMTNDIDASDTKNWNDGAGFLPIGKDENSPFVGTFDGNKFFINELYICTTNNYAGLFGYVSTNYDFQTNISNLKITNSIVTSEKTYVGGLIGVNHGNVEQCSCTGSVASNSSGSSYVGCLIGVNYGIVNNSNISLSSSPIFNTKDYNESIFCFGGVIGYNVGDINGCFIEEESTCQIIADGSSINILCGGLVGRNIGNISQCYSNMSIDIGIWNSKINIGGLVGENTGNIDKSYFEGNLFAIGENLSIISIGGLVSINYGNISQSYSKSYIRGYDLFLSSLIIGGFCYENNGDIINCFEKHEFYITGVVSNAEFIIGGFVSKNDDNEGVNGTITNCYSAGTYDEDTIEDSEFPGGGASFLLGGFCQENGVNGTVNNSFWDLETMLIEDSQGGVGKNTSQMQDINTFLNVNWDFENIWSINETINEGYPYLKENPVRVIENEVAQSSLQIYPNPATNQININYNGIIKKIEIYNITGQLILTATTSQIDVSELPNGIYQVVLRSEGKIETNQLIIMR